MNVTIKDVAKLAGTSTATVSLVLNDRPGVKEETRKKVREAVELIGYRPNFSARNLAIQKTNTLALIVTDIKNPFFNSLVFEMQQEADARGYVLLLGISNNEIEREKKLVRMMAERGVDGILLVPCRYDQNTSSGLEHLYEVKRAKMPIVFITDKYPTCPGNCVMTDLEQANFELTSYLLKRKHERIVLFCDGYGPYYSSQRIDGYKRAFKKYGKTFDHNWIVNAGTADTKTAIRYTRDRILSLNPDAIICINATSALGVMAVLKEDGISVPDDISVACFDELEYNNVLYMPLTYASQNLKEMCVKSLERMDELLQGDPNEKDILIPSKIYVGSSTD